MIMSTQFSPFVYWGQRKEFVSLNVDLRDPHGVEVKLTDDAVTFQAYGRGSQGDHLYQFHIDLYLPVLSEESQYKVSERNIELRLRKRGGPTEIWPRLTHDSKKLAWLKIDFDKFADVDCDDSDEPDDKDNETGEYSRLLSQLNDDYKSTKSSGESSNIRYTFLFLYNLLQLASNTIIFGILSYRFYYYGFSSPEITVTYTASIILMSSSLSILELLYSYLSWIKTDPRLILFLVVRRSVEMLLILSDHSHLLNTHIVFFVISNWCYLDIVQYLHTFQSLRGKCSEMQSWLHHTLWIPLYPLSSLLTGILTMVAVPAYEHSGIYSINLPNAFNISFSFPLVLRAYIGFMLIGSYFVLRQKHHERSVYTGAVERRRQAQSKDKTKKNN